jgi:UDP-N-acetyl-D-mannosaminuronic acid dehydrogenase
MIDTQKKVSVIGLGYIGLPTAALLASKGYSVNGTDINSHAVETINKGEIHIVEPDLDAYVRSAVSNGKLKAHLKVQKGDVYIICVPTPFHIGSGIPTPNIDYVKTATKNISPLIKDGDIIILESTSPVGTTELIESILVENGVDTSTIFIAYCPERVLPGKIMSELVENARVVGGINKLSTEVVAKFYKSFVNGNILETQANTAEMCKLTENSFRDVNIAFANELSMLCDKNGVDIWELIKLANYHPRVDILHPGAGVGGHCIAVDPWFIVATDPENARIIKTARKVNDSKPKWVVDKIINKANLTKAKKIACLGLAFKPDIDDLRESPAVEIVDSLIDQGFNVSCVEPNIINHKKYNIININEAICHFDIIVVLVKHKKFMSMDVLDELKAKGALDFCGIFVK